MYYIGIDLGTSSLKLLLMDETGPTRLESAKSAGLESGIDGGNPCTSAGL